MARVIPVLGAAGFATDLTIKADEVMSNFYITQRSQTDLYRGQVTSLSSIVSQFGNNRLELENEVRLRLQNYLDRQFDSAELDVSALSTPSGIDLQISAILRDGDKSIDLKHVVSSANSKIRSIIDLQNDGKPFIAAGFNN